MNSVQFGRWFSERRRACGWPSQRLLAEAAQQHNVLSQSGVSEDFLSRLEAGNLAYPFRGTVRRRVLRLAWLVCKTPRDLKAYLKAARLGDFSDDESMQLHLLNEHLGVLRTPPPLLLPPRPGHLHGREKELAQLMDALSRPEVQVFAITGMPGIGKSSLAHEALHRLAATENERLPHFPDGIATFSCRERQGTRGLISLLTEITALFTASTQPAPANTRRQKTRKRVPSAADDFSLEHVEVEVELASVIDRARAALANKRVLLLLDDLDPSFPLRQALDVLLARGAQTLHEQKVESGHEQRVILTTGQFVPSPALIPERLHLQPLSEAAALDLLARLLGAEFSPMDQVYARQACAAVGYLPPAIEDMATAIQTRGIPLTLVAAHLASHPLGGLLDSEEELATGLEKALAMLDRDMRELYILLAALDLSDFDLETAAAVTSPRLLRMPRLETAGKAVLHQPEMVSEGICKGAAWAAPALIEALAAKSEQRILRMSHGERVPNLTAHSPAEPEAEQLAHLASTAVTLGQFVRHSLLELLPNEPTAPATSRATGACNAGGRPLPAIPPGGEVRYHMHTLFYHYAREMAPMLPEDLLERAQHNLLCHVLICAVRERDNLPGVERAAEREVTLAALNLAWREKRYDIAALLSRKLLSASEHLEDEEGVSFSIKSLRLLQEI